MASERYDAVIVGSGQGGTPMAGYLAKAGRRVALVEAREVGGSCVNTGCTPSKTMIASARAAHVIARGGELGIRGGAPQPLMPDVVARKRRIVERFRDGTQQGLDEAGVELWRGRASFAGPRRLAVELRDGGRETLEAELIILNTGARLAVPPIDGLEAVPWLDSTAVMELDAVPAHLLVVGGGYIAVEFAQLFRRLGSRVTIAQRSRQLLASEDEDVAQAVKEVLTSEGIEVRLDAQVARAGRRAGGAIEIELEGGDTLRGSHLLLATGRRPHLDGLMLERAGIDTDARGFIAVDDRLETTAPGVYALGDLIAGPAFTHISYDHARVLRENLLDGGNASLRGRPTPYAIFIDPQLGRIGLSERQARARGLDYRVARMPAGHTARAIESGETQGLWKVLVSPGTREILGAAILDLAGGDVMAMLQIAMMGELPYDALAEGIFAHPTSAESLNNLFAGL